MSFELTYHRFSECSILIEWPSEIDEKVLDDVLLFKNHIESCSIKSIVQVNNAYNSILVIYNVAIDNVNDKILALKALYSERVIKNKKTSKCWKVPVCYDGEFGLDLNEISIQKNMSISDIITLHSDTIYTVFFIGFLPGFLYLGGLDKRLCFPRKKSPRLHIKKGAVAIGGEQTGIYPNASPGGWNIIGNSPLEFFNVNNDVPCFAKAGDKIQFVSVSRSRYNSILHEVIDGTYILESEVLDG
ncbi:5-oxoprolinase subunit PxpB [uncultured Psychroserpens sp.]|uniref:5-oxoprolinase subunit PxpB n=1 Tax=uncultured Psychroserpens sp. TaxID=255436 RepID=UPI00260F747B|nr:5-oxoprolinase subunit PxpB [uncultured Psychroserpens sp.]